MTLRLLPKAYEWFFISSKNEVRHLGDHVPNINILVALKCLSQFPISLSNCLQMALATLPKALWTILQIFKKMKLGTSMLNINIFLLLSVSKNFLSFSPIGYKWPLYGFLGLYELYKSSKNGIRHLSAGMPNIKIWVLLSVSHIMSFIFCQFSYNNCRGFMNNFSNIKKDEIRRLGAKVININIWLLLSVSRNFLYLSRFSYKWSSYRFPRLYEWFWKAPKYKI